MSDFEINNDTSYSSYDDSDYGGYDPNDQGGYLLPGEDSGDGGFNQNDEEEFGANYDFGADEYISNFNDIGNEVDSNLEIGPDDRGGYLFSGEDSGDDWGFCSDDSYYGGYDTNDQGGYLFSGEDGEDGWDFCSDNSNNLTGNLEIGQDVQGSYLLFREDSEDDATDLYREGVYYKNGIPVGEIGLEPIIPTPDVRFGVDSPIGGVTTTLHFGSGGVPTSNLSAPSYNIPLGPSVNLKLDASQHMDSGDLSVRGTISTPLGGGRLSGDVNDGDIDFTLRGPQLNFPLPYGINTYVGVQW
jgi:hypothetical protein